MDGAMVRVIPNPERGNVRQIFWTTGLRSCKVTISFYDCFVVAFAFTLVTLLPVCFKVRFGALSSGFTRGCNAVRIPRWVVTCRVRFAVSIPMFHILARFSGVHFWSVDRQ